MGGGGVFGELALEDEVTEFASGTKARSFEFKSNKEGKLLVNIQIE